MIINSIRDFIQPQYVTRYITFAILLTVAFQIGSITYAPFIFKLPFYMFIFIFTFPVLSEMFVAIRYINGEVVGKYVQIAGTGYGGWRYFIQVQKRHWVEEFEVSFEVFRILRPGDTYLGLGVHNYDTSRYDVPDVMDVRELFEGFMDLSLEDPGPDAPFVMTVAHVKKRHRKKGTPRLHYVYDVKDNI